jgi:RIO kinase 1
MQPDYQLQDDEAKEDSPFATFFDKGLITEVLHTVKSGKEATVYCCRAHPHTGVPFYAAKLYRPLEQRTFRNDAVYREGHVILDKRWRKAAEQRTRKGKEFLFGSWVWHEWDTLTRLFNAGADVPRPVAQAERCILMEFIGDERGAAPPLNRVSPDCEGAEALFDVLMRNIELWLACERIHADLSPFNILYHEGRITVIDFPQAIEPATNRNARDLLQRDIDNVVRYFARHGVYVSSQLLADRLWRRYERGEL